MHSECSRLPIDGMTTHDIALARCDCLIDQYFEWKADNHRKSDAAQRLALVFTAITPVLLLLPWEYVNILGAATSALAAIATGFMSISAWRDQYIRYGQIWHQLQSEKFIYLTRSAPEYLNCDEQAAARYFAYRVEQLVQAEVRDWRSLMQDVSPRLPTTSEVPQIGAGSQRAA